MRDWYNGITSGFHPENESSILSSRTNLIFLRTGSMKEVTYEEFRIHLRQIGKVLSIKYIDGNRYYFRQRFIVAKIVDRKFYIK